MSKVKIHVLHTGEVCVSPGLPFKDEKKNPNPVQLTSATHYGRKDRIWIPVSCYLIEHPKGLILYDTGWNRAISPKGEYDREAQIKHMTMKHFLLNQGILPEGKAVNEQLETIGIKTSDIDYVILSHLHTDHASGLSHVKDAKKIMVSRNELEDAEKHKVRYAHHMWDGIDFDLFDFTDYSEGKEVEKVVSNELYMKKGPVGKTFDLFGDGSIELILITGHTMGLSAMKINELDEDGKVKEDGKYVLLFSDGGYAEKSWKQMIPPGTALDEKMAYESLQWIHDVSSDKHCLESLANHDSDVVPHEILL